MQFKFCLFAAGGFLIVCLLLCGLLVATTTPLSTWLYQHNYYFQGLVDHLHGR